MSLPQMKPPGFSYVMNTLLEALREAQSWPEILRVSEAIQNVERLASATPIVPLPFEPYQGLRGLLTEEESQKLEGTRGDGNQKHVNDPSLDEGFGLVSGETAGPMFEATPHGVQSTQVDYDNLDL